MVHHIIKSLFAVVPRNSFKKRKPTTREPNLDSKIVSDLVKGGLGM